VKKIDKSVKNKNHPERYNSFNKHLREEFGEKVYKIPIDSHLPCPNKDGKISKEGCIFCDKYGSGPIKTGRLKIEEQIEIGIERIGKKYNVKKFIAYFQANTNTAASPDRLRTIFEKALKYKQIVGISIGTRPDWIFKNHFRILEELNDRTYLWVELGLQTIHYEGLKFLRRHHYLSDFVKTFSELKKRGIRTCVHTIIGIPGENREYIIDTAKFLSAMEIDGVKIHLLHILKNTDLEKYYMEKKIRLLSPKEYISLVIDFLEHLSPNIIVQRLTGERDREIFIAPEWALNKLDIINQIKTELEKRDSYQGKKLVFSSDIKYPFKK
jgi:radical SAM protein (TIGR01212 family)